MKLNFAKHIQKFLSKIEPFILAAWEKNNKSFVYVAIGDSSVEGVGASTSDRSYPGIIHQHLKLAHKDIDYNNLGKSGARIKDVLDKQLPKTLDLAPQLITISIGANDILHGTPFKEFEKDLHKLLSTLKKQTAAEIVISTIPDLTAAPAIPKHLRFASKVFLRRINSIIRKQAKKSQVKLVDVYESSRIYTQHYPEVISSDGLHPSDFGYVIWANAIIHELKDLLTKRDHSFFSFLRYS